MLDPGISVPTNADGGHSHLTDRCQCEILRIITTQFLPCAKPPSLRRVQTTTCAGDIQPLASEQWAAEIDLRHRGHTSADKAAPVTLLVVVQADAKRGSRSWGGWR